MLKERDRDVLQHIIKYCDQIDETIAMFDDSLETLKTNHVCRNAVSMCILQIGELTNKLTKEFKAAHTDVPWKAIITTRNIAAHHYERFSMKRVRDIIVDNIPPLRTYCQKLLDEDQQPSKT